MIGKRHSATLFGGAPAIVGAPVFVTTSDGSLIAGHVHHVTDETAAPGYRDRVFVAFLTAGGWDDDPGPVVKTLPFYDPKTREEADAMPPGHWCWPRTWQDVETATASRDTIVESDTWQSDAIPYCKVCHKTHGAVRGEKMCGGPGRWIPEQ